MTYAAQDTSAADGRPALLAVFTRGATVNRFTNQPTNVTKASVTYSAVSGITFPDHVTTSARTEQEEITFIFPRSNAFALAELNHDTSKAKVQIYRTHLSDGDEDLRQVWQGYIERATPEGAFIKVHCYSGRRALTQIGAGFILQKGCRHDLFDGGCKLVKATYETALNVTAVSGVTVTLDATVSDETQHVNGLLTWSGEEVNYDTISGTTLTLQQPWAALKAAVDSSGSEAVTVTPGCNKTRAANGCGFFSNQINFGGYDQIRDREIYSGRSAV